MNPAKRRTFSAANPRESRADYVPVVVVIGPQRRDFQPLLYHLSTLSRDVRLFADIPSALKDVRSPADADLTVVLQSWSDQFPVDQVNELIGLTLFRRLLCCYAVSCESDGRNRAIWPDAVRVPLRFAQAQIERELTDAANGLPPLPPTAARDEIFAHRARRPDNPQSTASHHRRRVTVIGSDRILRQTISSILGESGMRARNHSLLRSVADPRTPQEEHSIAEHDTSERRDASHVIVHDLDPWSPLIEESLSEVYRVYPTAPVIGVGTMPDAGLSTETVDHPLAGIASKLDLAGSLMEQLERVAQDSAVAS